MTLQSATSQPSAPLRSRPDHVGVAAEFNRLVDEQAALSRDQLNALHKQWFGPQGLFATFSAEVERLGRQAPALDDLTWLDNPQRLQEAERAVAFALAQSNRRGAAVNPFSGRARHDLCCVVFDETGAYTLVERYAAYEAMRQSDSDFFIKLIATTRGVVERRIVFRGLLEHFDRLLPIEKSIYPGAYREVQQAHLDREEGLYGPLTLSDSLVALLETVSPVELLKLTQRCAD
ncbi:hypothetical protein [Pseudomonas sp. F3-2]|jgi:hypothetical protein|uniref:hypothetical protein n=1 Tax=Pseudomonas sp. F3-2 TaxID=3141539 RepID=UPI00315DC9BC